jgi:hypothetical protein
MLSRRRPLLGNRPPRPDGRQPNHNCNCQLLDREEPLHSLAVEDLTGIQGALRVHGFHMHAEELASFLTHAANLAYDLPVQAIQKPDLVIGEIRNIQELLRLVRREHNSASGAAYARPFGDPDFLLEIACLSVT